MPPGGSNSGVSAKIHIGGESFSPLKGLRLSPLQPTMDVQPPSPKSTGQPSEGMFIYKNDYRDFAFQKINGPFYGTSENCLARITGRPANEPDFVADYHFIGLMRLVDKLSCHHYRGTIGGKINGVGFYE